MPVLKADTAKMIEVRQGSPGFSVRRDYSAGTVDLTGLSRIKLNGRTSNFVYLMYCNH